MGFRAPGATARLLLGVLEGAAAVVAAVALAVGFVFAVADDVLALAVGAVKDLDDHVRSLPSGRDNNILETTTTKIIQMSLAPCATETRATHVDRALDTAISLTDVKCEGTGQLTFEEFDALNNKRQEEAREKAEAQARVAEQRRAEEQKQQKLKEKNKARLLREEQIRAKWEETERALKEQRIYEKLCVVCGRPLTFFEKLGNKESHNKCL